MTESQTLEADALVLTVDAARLARGWLSVALAGSKDKGRPVLNRTVHIEAFPEGVRLIATDSHVLLRAWVGADDWTPEPGLDEAPTMKAIAHDPYGRGKNLLWYLLNLARGQDEDAMPMQVDLTVNDTEHDDTVAQAQFANMRLKWVTIAVPDMERLKLPTIEGEFPDWRPLDVAFTAESTDAIALAPEIVRRLADLERTTGQTSLLWQFGGQDRAARVGVLKSEPKVLGLVMPQRIPEWGAPAETPEPKAIEAPDDIEERFRDAVIDLEEQSVTPA